MVKLEKIEDRLWEAADHLRANSALRLNEFAEPVLGLIFLKFADVKFSAIKKELEAERAIATSKRQRPITSEDYHSRGVLYIPEGAHFSHLIAIPEGTNMGKAVNDAMKAIEGENKELAGILPKNYNLLENSAIISLLKNFNQIPDTIEGDAFGMIYEYFLGNFAIADGTGGGEFFTPTSIVKLIVEILEPFKGYIYDPACGSGGMFVQSVEFIKRHFENGKKLKAAREVSIYGQEKTDQTVRIAKMNLAIHGLSGDIKQGNTYYEDLHHSLGKFDFAMANPPFNVNGIDKERIKDDPRFPYGIPRADNGNYLWIQIFLSTLKNTGRAGFVMANSASDAGHSEKDIRAKMIDDGVVDVMVAVGANMFYNVTQPVTLWFMDKNKKKTDRKNKILFIDARNIYHQVDKAHRDWTEEQIQQIADIVRSYRGEGIKKYEDVKGLCKVATIEEVRANGYTLVPSIYTGLTHDTEQKNLENKLIDIPALLNEQKEAKLLLSKQIEEPLKTLLEAGDWSGISYSSIEVIEHLLQSIFTEWFVNYRFPEHKKVKLIDSGDEFGKIPHGWQIKKLDDVCVRIQAGGTPRRGIEDYWKNGDIDWYTTGELQDKFLFESKEKITEKGISETSAKIFERGTILMAIYGSPTVGRLGIATGRSSCNQAALGLVADENLISQPYLFYTLKGMRDKFNSQAVGAAQQNISKIKVSEARCLIADKKLIELFDSIALPVFKAFEIIQRQNAALLHDAKL